MSFRSVRITLLLLLFSGVAALTYWEGRSVVEWKQPLQIVVYPIAASDSAAVRAYTAALSATQFEEIATFIARESTRYRLKPVPKPVFTLGHSVTELPPTGARAARSALDNLLSSLKLRYYAFRNAPFWENIGRVRLFVVYHEATDGKPLDHSLGLKKGLFGVVHAFASSRQTAQNNVVIAHELLHTLGASDKYDANLMPIFPEGFAEAAGGRPIYPQRAAEIMAGRIAISATQAKIPPSLSACVIGYKTATEINW